LNFSGQNLEKLNFSRQILDKFEFFSTDFLNGLQYQISQKSVYWESHWYRRTDIQKDMTKLTGIVATLGTRVTNILPLPCDLQWRTVCQPVQQLFMLDT